MRNLGSRGLEPPVLPIESSDRLALQPASSGSEFLARPVRKVLPVVACAVLLYSVALAAADYHAMTASLKMLSARSIVLSLAFATASFFLRFVRWQRYLHWLGIRVAWLDSALMFTCGLGMSITPGKAGELLKPLMLHRVTGTALARSVPILAAERLTDAMVLVLLALAGLVPSAMGLVLMTATLLGCGAVGWVFASQRLVPWNRDSLDISARVRRRSQGARRRKGGSPFEERNAASGAEDAPRYARNLCSRGLGHWLIERASRFRWLERQRERLHHAHESLLSLCSPARLLEGFGWSLLAWSVHALCLYSLAHAFEGVSLSIGDALWIDSAPALAGALSMLPGGLGVIEASMTGALVAVGDGVITPALAAALTLAVRVTTLWWAVLLGLLALGVWQVRYRR